MTDVLLCSMPFGLVVAPSLALSLLKAILAEARYSAKVGYFSLGFAEQISYGAYQDLLGRSNPYQGLGDWLFAAAVFDPLPRPADDYVEQILRAPSPALSGYVPPLMDWVIELALAVRKQVEPFLDRCLQAVAQEAPRLVGFSCLHQQRLASLALAKRIKARWPQTFTLFGGTDCEGQPGAELVRQFPFVDAVVSGPGEVVLPQIVRRVLAGQAVTGLPGVYSRADPLPPLAQTAYPNAPAPAHLDQNPYPNFDDYFDQLKASRLSLPLFPDLPLETSRGCWWGQKRQCTFCSFSNANVAYSAKSPERALAEVEYFAGKYPGQAMVMADSVLDEAYFQEVLPALAKRRLGAKLFYAVRATLRRDQFALLRDCGVTRIQPGIESLSTDVLRRMHKGTTLFHNLQCLKWAREFGLEVTWNLLYGLPGEPPEAYPRMAELVPLLTHLPSPLWMGPVHIERFSPLFDRAQHFGLKDLRSPPAYAYIFPFDAEVLTNLSSRFIYADQDFRPVEAYTRGLRLAVETWQQVYPHTSFLMWDDGECLHLRDQRPAAVVKQTTLKGLQRRLYLACDEAQSLSQLKRFVVAQTGQGTALNEVEGLLQPLVAQKFMLREGQRFLSLAIPASPGDE